MAQHWVAPPGTYQFTDTITVVVEDRRTDKVCSFYISYFDKEFIIKSNKVFINERTSSGGEYAMEQTDYGYFKEGVLYYSQRSQSFEYTPAYNPVFMKLYKQ